MRLIDADALKKLISNDIEAHDADVCKSVLRTVLSYINTEPTIYAVPVVRCKDCKWYGDENLKICGCCMYWAQDGGVLIPTKFIDFCRYGERKDDETD